MFVRDRGTGFDPESVPADRQGVRNSILDRMTRHGGTAEIRSTPGLRHRGAAASCRDEEGNRMTTRVLIVDDHAMFRTGVRAELGTSVDVVAEAADVDEAVAGDRSSTGPTWCCSTCTCRAAAAPR